MNLQFIDKNPLLIMMYDPGLDFEAGKKKAIKGTETSDRI